jgi:hypothetical protein
MRVIRSIALLVTVCASLCNWIETPALAASRLAGHWRVTTAITCVSNGFDLDACQKVAGSNFAAFSLRGARLTVHATSEYVVDARGRFTGHGSSVLVETAHGHAALRACNPQQIASTLWTGTCFTAWSGRGHIASGKTGMLDFWLDHGTTTIHGTSPVPPYRIHFSTSSDSRIPAVPGTYPTARYFQLLHLAPVRGISVRTVVVQK